MALSPCGCHPVQVKMIPIADRHIEYANQVANELRAIGMRVEVDAGSERMNKKIRNAQLMKIPYMLVVGDSEHRRRHGGCTNSQQ